MKMKKTIITLSAVTAVGLGGFMGLHATQAANLATGTSIVDRLVSKFNLNKDEVQAVFTEDRQAHMTEHQQTIQDKLAQAVADKKLTQEQADLITAKHKEVQDYRSSLDGKNPQEERSAMKAKMDETVQWAKDNNIPQGHYLLGSGGFKGGKMGGEHVRLRGN